MTRVKRTMVTLPFMSKAVASQLIVIKKYLRSPFLQGGGYSFQISRFRFEYSNLSIVYYELPSK
jgi:hypothetical protein